MIYLIYLSYLSDLDHDLYGQSVRCIWSRSWFSWSIFHSIWSISWSIRLSVRSILSWSWSIWSIWSRTWSILSDTSDLDHGLSDLSVLSIWSWSWSIWYICPNYLIYHYIRSICPIHRIEIMIYLVYQSDLPDLDHDLPVRYMWYRSWSIWSVCPIILV